jgi:SNF2 family DNA or RNA helicase
MQLYPHQQIAFDIAKEKDFVILAMKMRTGKTPVACRLSIDFPRPLLIVCPAAISKIWIREMGLWADTEVDVVKKVPTDDIYVRYERLDPKTETMESKQVKTIHKTSCIGKDVVITSYDSLSDIDFEPKSIIFDEAHRLKSPEANRTKIATEFMKGAEKIVCLSGTPIPNRPIEIWPLLNGLGITDMSWFAFAKRYASAYQNHFGQWDVRGSSNEAELKELLAPHMVVMDREEIGGYREKVIKVKALDLPVDEREKEFNLKDIVSEASPEGFDGLAEILRMQGEKKAEMYAEDIECLLSIGESIIVFVHHKIVASTLEDALQEHNPVKIVGGQSATKTLKAVDAFQNGDTNLIICNIQAASEGVTLSRADRLIMLESSWVPGTIHQATDRGIIRDDTMEPLKVDILTIHNSIDEYVLKRALEKTEVINKVMPTHINTRS